jgi:hypothetical protein
MRTSEQFKADMTMASNIAFNAAKHEKPEAGHAHRALSLRLDRYAKYGPDAVNAPPVPPHAAREETLSDPERTAIKNLLGAMLATDETDPDRPHWISAYKKLFMSHPAASQAAAESLSSASTQEPGLSMNGETSDITSEIPDWVRDNIEIARSTCEDEVRDNTHDTIVWLADYVKELELDLRDAI